jgi:hypothetical protein
MSNIQTGTRWQSVSTHVQTRSIGQIIRIHFQFAASNPLSFCETSRARASQHFLAQALDVTQYKRQQTLVQRNASDVGSGLDESSLDLQKPDAANDRSGLRLAHACVPALRPV